MLNGIIVLNKPRQMTSGDCVYQLRKLLHLRRIGHAGTLDPDVDGVLPIAVGQATKLIELMHTRPKAYVGKGIFGFSTDSYDLSGKIVAEKKLIKPFSIQEIQTQMNTFIGTIDQIPPIYSAVRVNGKRLYEYARQGLEVQRPHRAVQVMTYRVQPPLVFDSEKGQQTFSFMTTCHKGTYVRSLVNDLGDKLGVPAVMSQLTRTASSGFDLNQSVTLDALIKNPDKIAAHLVPIEAFFTQEPSVKLTQEQWALVKNGVSLSLDLTVPKVVLWYQGKVKAIYRKQDQVYRPDLMLLQNE